MQSISVSTHHDTRLISQLVKAAKIALPGIGLALVLYHFGTAYLIEFALLSVLGMALFSRIESIHATQSDKPTTLHQQTYSDGGTFKKASINPPKNAQPVVRDGGSFARSKSLKK